jgi:hypothetical protein
MGLRDLKKMTSDGRLLIELATVKTRQDFIFMAVMDLYRDKFGDDKYNELKKDYQKRLKIGIAQFLERVKGSK